MWRRACLRIVTGVSVELAVSSIMVLVPAPEEMVISFVTVDTLSCWHHCENLNRPSLSQLECQQIWVKRSVEICSVVHSCVRTDGRRHCYVRGISSVFVTLKWKRVRNVRTWLCFKFHFVLIYVITYYTHRNLWWGAVLAWGTLSLLCSLGIA